MDRGYGLAPQGLPRGGFAVTDRSNITDAQFAARLDESEAARYAVTEYLTALGFVIDSHRPKKAVTYAEKGHEDVDIRAWHPTLAPKPQRIEVKGLTQQFSCHDDWPYRRIIVDEVEKFEEKDPKPWRYFLVSRCLRHAFSVDVAATRAGWVQQRLWDSFYKTEIDFYRVPISMLKVVHL